MVTQSWWKRAALDCASRSWSDFCHGLLGPDEVDRAIREWVEKTEDPLQKGLGAFYEERYPEAERLFRESLARAKAKRAQGEREIVESAKYLGRVLRDQGKYRESVEAFRQAVAEWPDDPELLNGLGYSLVTNGEYQDAEKVLRRSEERWIAEVGEDHPDTLAARNNLAQTLFAQGELSEARGLQERVLEASERLLGEDHPSTLTARLNLALTLKAQGDLTGAHSLLEQVLASAIQRLGEEHPDVALYRSNLASLIEALELQPE